MDYESFLKLVKNRRSIRDFKTDPIPDDFVDKIIEAARWAPSSFNEQPWFYIVARRDQGEEFEAILSCLMEGNQVWARNASVLALGVVSLNFTRKNRPNRHALHDLGLASAQLTLEATARGLSVHQMAGILPDKARQLYQIPEGFEAVTALAIGHRVADGQETEFSERDRTPRKRKPLSDFLFQSTWGEPADFLGP